MNRQRLVLICGVGFVLCAAAWRASCSDDIDTDEDAIRGGRAIAPPAKPNQPHDLKRQFVELAARRARRLNDDDLRRTIDEWSAALAAQDSSADEQLKEAIEKLHAIAREFPDTPAAKLANRALEAIEVTPVLPAVRENQVGKKVTRAVRPKSSAYRYDAGGYKWLRGLVSRDPATNLCRLTYAVDPFDDDRYGGSLPLVGDGELDSLKTGDVILAEGDVQLDGNDQPTTVMYRVRRVLILKGKED
jgi:hypothetical protein